MSDSSPKNFCFKKIYKTISYAGNQSSFTLKTVEYCELQYKKTVFMGLDEMVTETKTLEKIVETWREKKGTLIMILHEIQNHYGYIPEDVSKKLANLLDIPLARIYEVITFYHYFRITPPAKYKINVCMGTACYLKGATHIIDELKDLLNIDVGENTKDGLFQLESVRCLGCCGLAPVMTINEKIYGNLKKQDIHDIIASYTKEENK